MVRVQWAFNINYVIVGIFDINASKEKKEIKQTMHGIL